MLGELALIGGSALANGFLQQRAAAYNQKTYRENMAANFQYSQQAQRNAAANEVAGLRAAGLSPALADGAAGAGQVSAQGGTAQAPQVDPANLLLMAQLRNVNAQTEKTKAEAKSTELDNANKEGENSTLGQNMARFYKELADNTTDEDLKKFYLEQADFASKGDFVRGNYDALLKFFDLQGKPEEAIQRKLDKKLIAFIAEQRWNKAKGHTSDTSEFVRALSSLDARQSDLVAEQAANLIAARKQLDKDTELIGAKISLTNAQIEQVTAAARALENTNVLEMIDKGEYGKALVAMLLQVFNGLASKGTSYVQ